MQVHSFYLQSNIHDFCSTVVTNPWQFLFTILLCLIPIFAIAGYLAFQLAKDIERNEKD